MELVVGVMLIVLGIANLREFPAHVHSHAHSHGDYAHTHPHGHQPEAHPHRSDQTPIGWLDRHLGGVSLYQLVRPLVVGIVHGLAGSAAVALLVLAAIGNPRWGVLYLLIFGVGTIVGMMVITAAIAAPFALSSQQSRLAGRLRLASGLISVAFGCFIVYQIGIVHGLFTANPQWTPS
jgi:high-affinity nickel-transport protein